MVKGKRGWIKIVEAFTAILLITGILIIVVDRSHVNTDNLAKEIYEKENSILKEIQLNKTMRGEVLTAGTLPINWTDNGFPSNVKIKINSELPGYLTCEARICSMESECILYPNNDKDVYARAIAITSDLNNYNPRQLKLFCWRT